MIRASKDGEAKWLADQHHSIEQGITQIFRLRGDREEDPNDPIKLLEINENTIATGIMPLHFAPVPASGIHFPTVIVEVTPTEFDQLKQDASQLPNGWKLGEIFERPNGTR